MIKTVEWYQKWKESQMNRRFANRSNKAVGWLALGASAFFGITVIGLVGFLVLFAWFAKDLPSPDKVVRREGYATRIFDRKGNLIYDVYDKTKRVPIDISQVPMAVKQATVSIEDKNFYTHEGFDTFGIIRAVYKTLVTRHLQGGSTLTQQLVKNVLLTSERTLIRKIKEFVLTIQVERKYSKDQILQMYLNEADYGGTISGIGTAAETYFGKQISEVNLAEAAILAGLPQAPSRYSPFSGNEYIGRSKDVLRRMREDGYIDAKTESQTIEQLALVPISTRSGTLKAAHFVFYVKQELVDMFGEDVVEKGGLRVTTTLDMDAQDLLQNTISEEIKKVKHLNINNGAGMVMDPNTGDILAMVGSKGWEDPDYDGKYNVTLALRQPGSAIKPVTYLTGLREGYTASTLLMDTPVSFPGGDKPEYAPVNYDGKFRGPVLVREALGNSLNIPAVKMLALVGVKEMLTTAYDLGFSSLEPTKEALSRLGLAVTLGGGEIKMIDMIGAYSSFANGGIKIDPVAVLKVTDGKNNLLYERKQAGKTAVMTPEEAFIISSILSDPKARMITFGSPSALDIPGKTVAVKTGTTNDKKDNWTVGWTRDVITAVWVGNNDNSSMKQVASGVTGASPIWKKVMVKLLENRPDNPWPVPSGIVQVEVDKISGYRAHDGYDFKSEYFIKGTEPVGDDPVHKRIKVCKGEGKLATPSDIANGNYDEREGFYFKEEDPYYADNGNKNKWQEGILFWLSTQAEPKYHPPEQYCTGGNPLFVKIHEPGDKQRVDGSDVKVKVEAGSTVNIAKIRIKLDGNVRFEENTAGPNWEVTIASVSSGNHKIEVEVEDEKGNKTGQSVEFGMNADWAAPTPIPTNTPIPSPTLVPTINPTL